MHQPFTRSVLKSSTSTLTLVKATGETDKIVQDMKTRMQAAEQARRDLHFTTAMGKENL